jgi:hypothetical protein
MESYWKEILQGTIAVIFAIWIFGTIAKKAGYSRWFGLAMLVPLLNIGMLIWFANTEWPIQTSLVRLCCGEPETPPTAIWREGF